MRWNYLSILKLQRCRSLGMDKYFHLTHWWACDYLSMLGLKLFHISKRDPLSQDYGVIGDSFIQNYICFKWAFIWIADFHSKFHMIFLTINLFITKCGCDNYFFLWNFPWIFLMKFHRKLPKKCLISCEISYEILLWNLRFLWNIIWNISLYEISYEIT